MLWSAHWNRSCCNVVVNIKFYSSPETFYKLFRNVLNWVERLGKGLEIQSVLQKLKKRILVHHQWLIFLPVCSSVKRAIYVRNLFKMTYIFTRFLKEESKISVQKDFGPRCARYTQIAESEKQWFIECAIFITHESVMLVKTSKFEG